MLSKILSYGLSGIEAYAVEIEVDVKPGLPSVNFVGLPDQATKESKDRIKCAINNSGFKYPSDRITVNLAPADIPKSGPVFDLAIALGILASSSQINKERLKDFAFLGELSLDGAIRPIKGALPIAMAMRDEKNSKPQKLILPEANAPEAGLIEGIQVLGAKNLKEVIHLLSKQDAIAPTKINIKEAMQNIAYPFDFQEVKGQNLAKRALEVAAAGAHNVIMIGPPGSGKTMLAKRIPSIIPDMTLEEAIETTRIHSSLGAVAQAAVGLLTKRPFLAPHQSISDAAMAGGSRIPQPGEISLAHNGVLFLDELPEFKRNVLEALRQPLEEGRIRISRIHKSLSFPAKFMLVAAMNPCPCGYYTDPAKQCHCNTTKIERYLSKISGPLLDRIDIHIEVPAIKYKELVSQDNPESSAVIKERVKKARNIQLKRFQTEGIFANSHMNHKQIKKYCALTEEGQALLKAAIEELGFSARAYDKILKVARTIADLDESEDIQAEHVSEAIQYRSLDRQLF